LLGAVGGGERVRGAREREEEGIALGVDLDPVEGAEASRTVRRCAARASA
jgi:hypothetical protein